VKLLQQIPERIRGWLYAALVVVFALALVALLVVEVWQNGNAGEWLKWLVGFLGLGGFSMATANTSRK